MINCRLCFEGCEPGAGGGLDRGELDGGQSICILIEIVTLWARRLCCDGCEPGAGRGLDRGELDGGRWFPAPQHAEEQFDLKCRLCILNSISDF